jgi:hypothetical protein
VWMMGVANSYTMEASFGGSYLGGRAGTHFTIQDYEQMGRHFCETLLDFCDEDPSKVRRSVWQNAYVYLCPWLQCCT